MFDVPGVGDGSVVFVFKFVDVGTQDLVDNEGTFPWQ
jgi:hypothetical protein